MATGRKWKPGIAVSDTKAALRHWNIVEHVQQGRGGFGLGTTTTPTLEKATPTKWRQMVVMEVRHQEEVGRHARAVTQAQQGQWVRWDGIENRKITWIFTWKFIVRATYYVLPSPANLHLWLGEDPACPLCAATATLRHIGGL